jgi:hypothetical protein
MGIERRKFRCLDLHLKAKLWDGAERTGDSQPVLITNLGPEGAFLEMPALDLLSHDRKICLDFRIESYPTDINVTAQVLYKKKEPSGLGIQFFDLPPFERAAIVDYIIWKNAELRRHDSLRSGEVEIPSLEA